jgi:hypothetical protein
MVLLRTWSCGVCVCGAVLTSVLSCVRSFCATDTGSMMDNLMGQNVASLAFGGGMKAMSKQSHGRTYYMQCSSFSEAQEWANAIKNNIAALPVQEGEQRYTVLV